MGLTATDLDLVIKSCERGPRPARIATIGRLTLFLHPEQHRRLCRRFPDAASVASYQWGDFCEPVLAAITGASEIVSIDVSGYQGATRIHDMNLPIADAHPDLVDSFDLVIDGGTLEHVFDFPRATANLMALTRVGGHVLTANPANNLCGHGFYQFTPELMHRLYSSKNGFEVEYILLTASRALSVERDRRPRSFQVADPRSLGRRIFIRNNRPVMIRTLARKLENQALVPATVAQSDYVVAWDSAEPAKRGRGKQMLKTLFARLPFEVQTAVLDRLEVTPLRAGQAMTPWRGLLE